MSNRGGGSGGGLIGFLLGVLGGALAAYAIIRIIEGVTSYDCPECGKTVRLNDPYCPSCGVEIEWD